MTHYQWIDININYFIVTRLTAERDLSFDIARFMRFSKLSC